MSLLIKLGATGAPPGLVAQAGSAGGKPRPATLVSNVLADPRQSRLAVIVTVASLATFLVAAPFAQVPLTPVPAFIPAYEASLVVINLITAVLLFSQFVQVRSNDGNTGWVLATEIEHIIPAAS